MPYINEHIFAGHLGADATFFELPAREGQPRTFIANFRVAATKRYSLKSGTRKERTTWFTVKLSLNSNGVSFFTDKLKKGSLVFVQGEPQVDERTDEKGKHWFHFVRADRVEILLEAKSQDKSAAVAEEEEIEEPIVHCSDIPEYDQPPRVSQPAVPSPAKPHAPVKPASPPPPAPPPRARPEPAAATPQRVHPLPDDAHTRFDSTNW